MSESDDCLLVYLRDCTVPLFIGVYDEEKRWPQPVIINIEARAPLKQRYDDLQADAVDLVINYAELYEFVTQALPRLKHVPLLESLAEHIISFCFKDLRISEVHVRLDKPEIFKGKALVGIEMRRRRA